VVIRPDRSASKQKSRMLRPLPAPDFTDPAHELRRLFSEAWGTFLLVVVACGVIVVGATKGGGGITLGMIVVAPGIMVMAIIYFMGAVSGAHLNPAVTLAFAARRNFPWRRVPDTSAHSSWEASRRRRFCAPCSATSHSSGQRYLAREFTEFKALIMEILLTTGLVSTILGTASGARNIGANGAIAVGGYIALAGLWAAPVSGASMNPVRSFAPDLLRGNLTSTWIYIVGPVIGAMIAVVFEWILKGHATASGTLSAQGDSQSGDDSPPES